MFTAVFAVDFVLVAVRVLRLCSYRFEGCGHAAAGAGVFLLGHVLSAHPVEDECSRDVLV
jgi:hypothetical protein